MKTLFVMDIKNYNETDTHFSRPSARAIIVRKDGKLALVYSKKMKYYKFPGGGIEGKEEPEAALVREVQEETGLIVKRETITEYGSVLRIQKSDKQEHTIFQQRNDYYICETEEAVQSQNLDEYEKEAEFVLRFASIEEAIDTNKACRGLDDFDLVMIERDTRVLELLLGRNSDPSVAMAEFLLREGARSNPGPWERHSIYVAESAKKIASLCPEMDCEKAYVYGLLHDIGRRFGVSYLAHVYDGYHYLMDLGYSGAAKVVLTHSFNRRTIDDYIGKFDIPKAGQDEIEELLAKMEYDDYDLLIQLCDSIATADGVVTLEERMNDVKSRYGYYPQEKWDKNIELRRYFEEKMGKNLYEAVWGKDSFRKSCIRDMK